MVNQTLFLKCLVLSLLSFYAQGWSYSVGMLERKLGSTPNWKITRANTMQMDISHRFLTPLEEDGDFAPTYENLLGMDGSANIGLSLSYGIANLTEITFSRYRYTKLYHLENKWKILDQYVDRKPISLAAQINYGVRTAEAIEDRNTYGYHFILGKYFWNELFNFNFIFAQQAGVSNEYEEIPYGANWTSSLGSTVTIRIDRWSITGEYLHPLQGYLRENKNKNGDRLITDIWGVSMAYRTYQHVFSFGVQNHGFNHFGDMIAGANNQLNSHTDLRFGFNIVRELDFLNHAPAKR